MTKNKEGKVENKMMKIGQSKQKAKNMKSAEENLHQPQDSEDENIHIFSLNPINCTQSSMPSVIVDFSPIISEKQQIAIIPKLSESKDCFHPLFENPYIKSILFEGKQIPQQFISVKQGLAKSPFSQRSVQYKKDGFKPRPSSKYCQVCKQKFSEDYLDVDLYLIKHIKHIVHVNNLKANPFEKYMQNLTLNFQTKKIPKGNRRSIENYEDLSRSKKRVKQQCNELKDDDLQLNFPLKCVESTESTNNSSVIEHKQKKNHLNFFKY